MSHTKTRKTTIPTQNFKFLLAIIYFLTFLNVACDPVCPNCLHVGTIVLLHGGDVGHVAVQSCCEVGRGGRWAEEGRVPGP